VESISECLIRYIDVTTPILILNITDTVLILIPPNIHKFSTVYCVHVKLHVCSMYMYVCMSCMYEV
jgi:hypothetical protein